MRAFLNTLRTRLRRLRNLADAAEDTVSFAKYIPGRHPGSGLVLRHQPANDATPLPVPPRELWLGYAEDEKGYVESGRIDVANMRTILEAAGWTPRSSPGPVLDLGCGGGRMIRHLQDVAAIVPVWGMDISAPHINWLKTRLTPPFGFAVATTIPHLPFADRQLGLVYCGSVFTHIDDLAETWFMEVARILAPGGVFYCTLHDEHTREKLAAEPFHPLARVLRNHELSNPQAVGADIVVVGEDANSNVFYHGRYLRAMLAPLFEIVRIVPAAYGYQTAWVLRKRA